MVLDAKLTVLHLSKRSARMLRASTTMSPPMMALVVAMAGIMLPAIAAVCGSRGAHGASCEEGTQVR